nr:hypothetical protein [Catenulispora rubra]
MFGAKKQVSSSWQASSTAMKCSIVGEKPCAPVPASTGSPSRLRRLMWMWQELPSRSSYLARNVRLMPSWSAISLAPVL